MAILLTGSSPFYHRREIVMLRSIMEARYSMEGPDWAGISKNAKILIKQMLTLDQSKRITAQEVRLRGVPVRFNFSLDPKFQSSILSFSFSSHSHFRVKSIE